jgi:hypothetical protein
LTADPTPPGDLDVLQPLGREEDQFGPTTDAAATRTPSAEPDSLFGAERDDGGDPHEAVQRPFRG